MAGVAQKDYGDISCKAAKKLPKIKEIGKTQACFFRCNLPERNTIPLKEISYTCKETLYLRMLTAKAINEK